MKVFGGRINSAIIYTWDSAAERKKKGGEGGVIQKCALNKTYMCRIPMVTVIAIVTVTRVGANRVLGGNGGKKIRVYIFRSTSSGRKIRHFACIP